MTHDLTLAICSYNSEQYIIETLQCIVNQTHQAFDLLIVNDCSTDDSIAKASDYLTSVGREFSVANFTENRGLAAGRAYVERSVETKYILFVDADDCPKPNLVERLYSTITADADLIAVGCYNNFIDGEGQKIKGGIFLGARTKEEFFIKAKGEKLIFMQPTAIIDREAVLRVGGRNITGFPEGKPRYQDLCEDLDLWTRMSDLYVEGKAIVVVPEVLLHYRKHSQSMSASNINMSLRMKHIKRNLKLRRAGKPELSFIDFMATITPEELAKIKRDTENGDRLRNGVMLISKGNIIKGGYLVVRSIIGNPKYFWQKIKANSRVFR